MVRLKGITWDHPRGYAPLIATASAYSQGHPDVEIVWEKRPLEAFENRPLNQLGREFDLLVIDHPHVGAAARDRCLARLEDTGRHKELQILEQKSVGGSHQSYQYKNGQWALAIDTAAQASAYRADLLPSPPANWREVVALSGGGRVLWPLRPVHALMSFFTLAASAGTPCGATERHLIREQDGVAVLCAMDEVFRNVPRECLDLDPIGVLEGLSEGEDFVYSPLVFCYANYARRGFRRHLIRFGSIPEFGSGGARSILGGAGIAVSAWAHDQQSAVDYAFWLAGADCQKTIYFESGGQPANRDAWEDDAVNALSQNFFRELRTTMDQSWMRPRHAGYLEFQKQGGSIIHEFLERRRTAKDAVRTLQCAYEASWET